MKKLKPQPFSKYDFGGRSGAQVHFHREKQREMRKNSIGVLKTYERPVFLMLISS